MKKEITLLVAGFILGVLCYSIASALFLSPIILPIFSPDGGEKIISEIKNAKESIDIESYLLTSDSVIEELKNAHYRGLKVRVILEKRVMGDSNALAFEALRAHGIEVKWASKLFKLTHSKILIIDNKKVIVGSHNLSESAFGPNREISVLIENSAVVAEFKKIFEADWKLASD